MFFSPSFLAFSPTFSKRPLADTMTATIGGNATIICQPDASPSPEITWSLNDAPLNLVKGAEGRVLLLDNGNLFITQVQMSDQGRYTCTAENLNGRASSTGLLSVVCKYQSGGFTIPKKVKRLKNKKTLTSFVCF